MSDSKYFLCILFLLQVQTIFSATFCDVDDDCSGLANTNPCKAWRCTGLCTSNICLLKRSSLNDTEIDENSEEAKRATCPCCRLDNLPTGTDCDDGIFCNGLQTCTAGVCGSPVPQCTTGDVCKQCNEGRRSCISPQGTTCSDNLYCNGVETCDNNGNCVSSGNPCPNGACTQCNEANDNCYSPSGTSCADNLFCNGQETCNGQGQCVGGSNPCAAYSDPCRQCNEAADSCYSQSGTSCSDGLYCNGADTCDGSGNCNHAGNPCNGRPQCDNICNEQNDNCRSPSGTSCNDGLFCTATDTCNGQGTCVGVGSPCSTAECNSTCNEANRNCFSAYNSACTGDAYQCTNDICDGVGHCTHPLRDGQPCNDGNACTSGDLCTGTTCSGTYTCTCSIAADCDDGNPCTTDVCNGGSCAHNPNSLSCNDGLWCNGADTCSGGSCSIHAGDPCSGGIPCRDFCNEQLDVCRAPVGSSCPSDGLYCNGVEKCDLNGNCVGSGDPCSNGLSCANACNETSDNCFSISGTLCSDGLFCNGLEKCDGRGNCVSPGNPCVNNTFCNNYCNEQGTSCARPSGVPCDDGVYCNGADYCTGTGFCGHEGNPCQNATVCYGACNETTRGCMLSPKGDPCGAGGDNGIFCDGIELCDGFGNCTLTSGNPCVGSDCDIPCDEANRVCNLNCKAQGNNNEGQSKTGLIAGVAGGAGGAFVIVGIAGIALLFIRRRKRRDNGMGNPIELEDRRSMDSISQDSTQYKGIGAQSFGDGELPTKASVNISAPSWEIPYKSLSFIKDIGAGAFGVVKLGKWRGTQVAIKTVKNLLTQKQLEDFKMEIEAMAKLRPHKNIVTFLGVCTDPKHPLCIVTEYMKSGSLWARLQKSDPISDTLKIQWIRGIACGMLHLHSEGIIHRDLACRNVLLGDDESVPKISDFGMSRVSSGSDAASKTKSEVGPLKYMPPESIIDRVYSTKSDVWSFAIVIIEVATKTEPYPNFDVVQAATKVTHGYRHPIPTDLNMFIAQIINECFEEKPSDRPEFDKIFAKLETIDTFSVSSSNSNSSLMSSGNQYGSMLTPPKTIENPPLPVPAKRALPSRPSSVLTNSEKPNTQGSTNAPKPSRPSRTSIDANPEQRYSQLPLNPKK